MVKARFEKLSGRQDIRVIRYSDTEVVRSAGEVVFVKAHQQGAVVALWRQLSGDAHGLAWATLTRARTTRAPVGRDARYPLPITQMTSGGDLRELVDDFWAAYRILKVGWSLFDQCCTGPH